MVIFSDHSVITRELLDGSSHNMISIAAAPATSPFWLVNAIVEDLTLGMPHSLNSTIDSTLENKGSGLITILSFMHDAKHFSNAFSKLKIPLSSYKINDLLTDFMIENLSKPISEVTTGILKLIPENPSSVVILEMPEILLSLFDGFTSDDLHRKLINPLRRRCGLLIMITNLNGFVLDGKDATEFSRFLTSSYFKSIAVLSLRPLDTGRANDVTGSLRITRGGSSANCISSHVLENEYLYLNQKESTRLFYR